MFVATVIEIALTSRFSVLATVALYLILCLEVSLSVQRNLRILKAQLFAARRFNIDPRSTPAWHKYQMYRRLTCLATGYVLVELAAHTSFAFTDRYGGSWWIFVRDGAPNLELVAAQTRQPLPAPPHRYRC